MDLRTLHAFAEVVRQGGFSRAAKTVFATQSTVSKAVKALEDEIGLPLLDRTNSPPSLTAAGEIVYRRAIVMLGERDNLLEELAELRGLKRGVLRIGFPIIGSTILFAPIFAEYRQRYPGIDIRLTEHGSQRLEELVLNGDLDLAGCLLPVGEAFEWQEVACEPLDLLVAANHPLAGRDRVRLEDLETVPFILFGEGFALNPIILDACRRIGFQPEIASRSSQIEFILELVAAGVGVGFLPRRIVLQRAHEGVRNVAVDDPCMVWRIALIWRRGCYLSQAARVWIDLVRTSQKVQSSAPPGA